MKNDSIRELYQLVEAMESCCRLAPVGLAFLLGALKDKIYNIAVQLENGE